MLWYLLEPTEVGPVHPFLRRVTEPGETYEGLILGVAVNWLYTHYNAKRNRTDLCEATRSDFGGILDIAGCQLCQMQAPERIRGYLQCWSIRSRREEFLEITPHTWKFAKASWPAISSLRGWRLLAVRGRGKTARLSVTLSEPIPETDMKKFPPPALPEDCLRNCMK